MAAREEGWWCKGEIGVGGVLVQWWRLVIAGEGNGGGGSLLF